jgi:hypothetical protein
VLRVQYTEKTQNKVCFAFIDKKIRSSITKFSVFGQNHFLENETDNKKNKHSRLRK